MLILVPGLRKQEHLRDGDSRGCEEPASIQDAPAYHSVRQDGLRDVQFLGSVKHLFSTPLNVRCYGPKCVLVLAHHP
jgi:hypothetical protein